MNVYETIEKNDFETEAKELSHRYGDFEELPLHKQLLLITLYNRFDTSTTTEALMDDFQTPDDNSVTGIILQEGLNHPDDVDWNALGRKAAYRAAQNARESSPDAVEAFNDIALDGPCADLNGRYHEPRTLMGQLNPWPGLL